MTDADRKALKTLLDRPLDDLMAELELYDPASRGPGDAWNKIAGPLRQRLCVEWGWCQVRKDERFGDVIDLGIAVFAVLAASPLRLPLNVDVALVTAIVVKFGLDKFCRCPQ